MVILTENQEYAILNNRNTHVKDNSTSRDRELFVDMSFEDTDDYQDGLTIDFTPLGFKQVYSAEVVQHEAGELYWFISYIPDANYDASNVTLKLYDDVGSEQANGTLSVDGSVIELILSKTQKTWVTEPGLVFDNTGTGGSGAAGKTHLNSLDIVSKVTLTAGGTGYETAPIIDVTGTSLDSLPKPTVTAVISSEGKHLVRVRGN